jgi:hypothetical protein
LSIGYPYTVKFISRTAGLQKAVKAVKHVLGIALTGSDEIMGIV